MKTYFKDFVRLADAREYANRRANLGHNVRYFALDGKKPHRIYFGAGRIVRLRAHLAPEAAK